MSQVLLLDELTTFLDGEDQRGVLEAVRKCVGGPDQACLPSACTPLASPPNFCLLQGSTDGPSRQVLPPERLLSGSTGLCMRTGGCLHKGLPMLCCGHVRVKS